MDIPDGARILAVADTWDAVTVARPYGAPRSKEDALEEVQRSSGTHLCPAAVAALIERDARGTLELLEDGPEPVLQPQSSRADEPA